MPNSLGRVGITNRVLSQRHDEKAAVTARERNTALDQQNKNSTIRRADERTRIGSDLVEARKGGGINIRA